MRVLRADSLRRILKFWAFIERLIYNVIPTSKLKRLLMVPPG